MTWSGLLPLRLPMWLGQDGWHRGGRCPAKRWCARRTLRKNNRLRMFAGRMRRAHHATTAKHLQPISLPAAYILGGVPPTLPGAPENHSLKTIETTNIMVKEYLNEYYSGHIFPKLAMVQQRTYSKYAQEAAFLLGQQIRLGRKQRQWSEQNLAERAGISRATLQKIEAGALSPSIGLVFEVAALVGVPLFEQDSRALATGIELTQSKIALLPQRIRNPTKAVDDDF